MLKLYRRHGGECKHKSRSFRACNCPIWVQGSYGPKSERTYIRQSVNTRDWEAANNLVVQMEAGRVESDPVTFLQAKERFIVETERRNLHWSTEKKYKLIMRQLEEFCAASKILLLKDINLESLRAFVGTLKDGPLARTKKIDRLRGFFKFCLDSKWIDESPAKLLKMPQVKRPPTLPFSDMEISAMLGAAQGKTKTFALLLLYSGLRISDASMLQASSITGDKLFLRQEKTGEPVYVPLPKFLVDELHAIQPQNGYFFANGSRRKETVANTWRKRLSKVFESVQIANGHPHRFRDTFAVNLLQKGTSIESVSRLLGHSSILVTQKHYSPFVKSLQKRLEEEVRKTW